MKAALNYLPNPPAPPGNIASLPRPPKHHIYLIVLSLNMAITLVHLGGQQMMINTSKCFLYTEEKNTIPLSLQDISQHVNLGWTILCITWGYFY